MASTQADRVRDIGNDSGSRTSDVPLLGEGFSESTPSTVPSATEGEDHDGQDASEHDPKTGKRRFWGFGKKKEEPKGKAGQSAMATSEVTSPVSPMPRATVSPQFPPQLYGAPSSPGRPIRSNSPRLLSPASSQIFERNVQEEGMASASPAIPNHITTENHIPPVLDASSVAITDDHLNPDSVEIVMHSAHQPAAVTVTGAGAGPSEAAGINWPDDLLAHPDSEEAASNYGALDSADVRRLSFISFADVVHAEQADHSSLRDASLLPSLTNLGSPLGPRSPSPVRSPGSPLPPMSGSPGFRTVETSPNRAGRIPGSPRLGQGGSPPSSGELTIETMSQALRKSGSRDLTGVRSAPMSPHDHSDVSSR
ncbi:hypothetical protein MMC19_001265 [Ptychographa xylographoides]|nr:hypothetical protein [Ptychographa xylographoides]